jgi:hypothetical protein
MVIITIITAIITIIGGKNYLSLFVSPQKIVCLSGRFFSCKIYRHGL